MISEYGKDSENMRKPPEVLLKMLRARSKKINMAGLALLPSEDIRRLYNSEVSSIDSQFTIQYESNPTAIDFNANMAQGDGEEERVLRFNCRLPEAVEPLCIYLIPGHREIDELVERLSQEEKSDFLGQINLDLTSMVVSKTDQSGFEVSIRWPRQKERIVDSKYQMLLQYVDSRVQ